MCIDHGGVGEKKNALQPVESSKLYESVEDLRPMIAELANDPSHTDLSRELVLARATLCQYMSKQQETTAAVLLWAARKHVDPPADLLGLGPAVALMNTIQKLAATDHKIRLSTAVTRREVERLFQSMAEGTVSAIRQVVSKELAGLDDFERDGLISKIEQALIREWEQVSVEAA